MGDASSEAAAMRGLRHGAGAPGDGCAGGGGWVSGKGPPAGATSSGSSSSLFSSTSNLTDEEDYGDDEATSSPPGRRRISSSSLSSSTSSSSESDTMQADGGGPLCELSTMLDHLPALRTGLSKYYQGRSQSFTSLAHVSCVEDLAKKTIPSTKRTKASRSYTAALGAKNRLSKTIAKKAITPDRLLSRARSTSLLRSSGRPPAYQGKREVYRC